MSTGDWRIRRPYGQGPCRRWRNDAERRIRRACGQGLSRSHGYRELPRGWSVSKISLPRQCPPARQLSSRLPAPRPSCPSGIRSGRQPCHVRRPGPRSATPFGAAPFALWRPYPPGGLGKFLRTNMTAMPGKVACLYAIVCRSPGSPCRMSLPLRAVHSGSCRAVT